jgi:hypothetical protein
MALTDKEVLFLRRIEESFKELGYKAFYDEMQGVVRFYDGETKRDYAISLEWG